MTRLRPLRLLLLGILLTLFGLELLLRLLPVSTATMVDYHVAPTILTYPPHLDFTVATGWDLKNARHLRSNNYGFVDTQDFVPNPQAIAVIGDSFVEANMLAPDDRIGPALSRALGGAAVYSMGGPGSSLLDYAERARLAASRFGIQRFVFVLELGMSSRPCAAPATTTARASTRKAAPSPRTPGHRQPASRPGRGIRHWRSTCSRSSSSIPPGCGNRCARPSLPTMRKRRCRRH